MARIELCVFDAYGTLFDVGDAARRLASAIEAGGPEAEATGAAGRAFAARWSEAAEHWRRKQLEYTWLRAAYGAHRDFWDVTGDGLDWTLDALAIPSGSEREALRTRLMGLYETLAPYPEAKAALQALAADQRRRAILSNGAPKMLSAAVASAGFGDLLEAALSAEEAAVFKPSPKIYDLVETRLGVAPSSALFVSSNGWDICCAAAYGFRTVWVNRRGDPLDRLPGAPEKVIADLSSLPAIAKALEN
ncbi:MAG: haloacid dehalogenase type II [Neomegalonema sp.]|nr:haloacid dehalogenase type II [Neomegalonema sp.]